MRLRPFYVCLSPRHFGRSKDEEELEGKGQRVGGEMKPESIKVPSDSICLLEVSVDISVV